VVHGWRRFFLSGLCLIGFAAPATEDLMPWREKDKTGELQARVDRLRPGGTLRLEAGTHRGPIVIRTSHVSVVSAAGARISGDGLGSVVVIEAQDVTLRGLHLVGSGDSYEQVNAGISVRSSADVRLEDNVIQDCLFGIDIAGSERVLVEGNRISSKALDLGLRGDGIRVWASEDVEVRRNFWSDTRDVVSWYSKRVRFDDNEGTRSRYSLHSMYSTDLFIRNNFFHENSVGIFVMYGSGTTILDNRVRHSLGPTGMGLGLKETSGVYAQGNSFLYCATGILVDNSPWLPSARNWFFDNRIAFNQNGVLFSNDREGNEFRANILSGNVQDADSESRNGSRSLWVDNAWDRYDGFDGNHDGVGDTPYILKKYADVLTSSDPAVQFFRGAPVLALIDVIARLVPTTDPTVVLRDERPRFHRGGGG
jgi:nitrous oxidase accessory protein